MLDVEKVEGELAMEGELTDWGCDWEGVLFGGGGGALPPEKIVEVRAEVRTTSVGALETVKGWLIRKGSMTVLKGKYSEYKTGWISMISVVVMAGQVPCGPMLRMARASSWFSGVSDALTWCTRATASPALAMHFTILAG
jgi:hypothetical protein